MTTTIELSFFRPTGSYNTRNLSDKEFSTRNLAFDQEKEDSWEQILRVRAEQANSPQEVLSVSAALNSQGLYSHILKVGKVAVYRTSTKGSYSVLIRKTFTGPDGFIKIEFGTGCILEVKSGSLFWEEHWIQNPGTDQSETGYSEVEARIHQSHQFNYVNELFLNLVCLKTTKGVSRLLSVCLFFFLFPNSD